MYWPDDGSSAWGWGGNSTAFPAGADSKRNESIASYRVLDELLLALTDRARFPALRGSDRAEHELCLSHYHLFGVAPNPYRMKQSPQVHTQACTRAHTRGFILIRLRTGASRTRAAGSANSATMRTCLLTYSYMSKDIV